MSDHPFFTTAAEAVTVPSFPQVRIEDTPPAPVKRRTMEQDPIAARPATRQEVEAIEDQILTMAFGKAMRTLKRRTLVVVFLTGVAVGIVAWSALIVILLDKAGAN